MSDPKESLGEEDERAIVIHGRGLSAGRTGKRQRMGTWGSVWKED